MLADDELSKLRENYQDPLPSLYYEAFVNINNDPNQKLMVIENEAGEIIGTLQLSFIQYLTYQGGIRAQVEAVRIRNDQQGQGIGDAVFTWSIQRAKERGAHVLQLTTDKQRPDAIRFYEKPGFNSTKVAPLPRLFGLLFFLFVVVTMVFPRLIPLLFFKFFF